MNQSIDDILTELACKGWQDEVHEIEKALEEKNKEIEKLNYIIDKQDRDITSLTKSKLILKKRHNKAIEAINVYQNEKTLSIGYEDLKRIRGILQGNEFDLKMFEEYLQELKGVDK